MKRPVEVTPICLVLIAASIVGLYSYGDDRGWAIELSAIVSSIIVLFTVVGFWLGDRWCHRLLVLTAGYAMIRTVMLAHNVPEFDRIVILVEAALAIPLLIWLFTPRVDAFTRQGQSSPADHDEELEDV